MPPCLALHICSKAKVMFTKITSSCMTLISVPLKIYACHILILPLPTKPLVEITYCKPSRNLETLKHLTEERDKKCNRYSSANQVQGKKSYPVTRGTLEFGDEVLVHCIVSINTFLSNKVSDLSFPPTYNMLHAVTLRRTLSSE